ncbi:efflux RND transporter periplasmic adaptor subunit [Methylomarinum sp. Ch1-1]|uniref:Efflux RND transporter periplasmic adaptor subunit n=1 Tax=Methylomarinum roseum TaxID=3067653 RepID=A0AAU7NR86_9GAMM|nr:efflux RND transporter periplasmic adaptor subunit [Methylomarinum sp. Ch1-1]MDP4520578.1 efflux RND transporter periplasmic adaptor subunit [Methylomarinum sp. Ch1-1]
MHLFPRFYLKILFLIGLPLSPLLSSAAEQGVPVRVAPVERMSRGQQLSLPGEITTQRISQISSRVDAMVVEVKVEEGSYVEQGDVLIRLDDQLTRFDLERSIAALEEARAQLQESKRQRGEFSRLIGDKFIAKTSYEAAQSKVRISAAVVKRLQAERQRFQELLNRHVIKAPFSGVISEKLVEVGQWVKVGNSVLTLVDNHHLRVEVDVPQRYFSRLSTDTDVVIVPDALPAQKLTTKVSHIIPVANATSHYFPVHIDIDSESLTLAPGMTVRVKLLSGPDRQKPVLLVPRDALIKQPDQSDSVWLIKKQQDQLQAQAVEVTVGQVFDNLVEIVAGQIADGDRVVIRGNEILKPGQVVRIIP